MSAIALVLAKRGFSVSGSDKQINSQVESLIAENITIFKNQEKENITKICSGNNLSPVVVTSTAIPENNPELQEAKKAKLNILHRSDILNDLVKNQPSILIGGSHGKTTTSTVISTLLALCKEDPTSIIGGINPYYNNNAHSGLGKFLIAEADESDGSIIKFKPEIGLLTNLDLDHTNYYASIESLIETMQHFGENSKTLLANYDCPKIRENFNAKKWWSTKTIKGVDFSGIPIEQKSDRTIAKYYENEEYLGELNIPIAGLHNLSNVIGGIAACRIAGIPFKRLESNVINIQSPGRRFEFRGIWKGRKIYDDYAHHPKEIEAALSLARLLADNEIKNNDTQNCKIISVFQPHRFSRTKVFLKDFAKSLLNSDCIILAPIYDAGEIEIEGASSQLLANSIRMINPSMSVLVATDFEEIINLIKQKTLEGDLVINMGAGNINKVWTELNNLNYDPLNN